MSKTREKLIEICRRYDSTPPCDTCKTPIGSCSMCGLERLIDYLIANGVTVQKWIPANEPPNDTEDQWVIYDSGTGYGYTMGYFDGERWLSSSTGFQLPVVGWMPLPEPPKGE